MIRARINSEPFEYKNASLSKYDFSEENASMRQSIEQFADRSISLKEGSNLFLWSKTNGVGKTYLAYAILREVRRFDQHLWDNEKGYMKPCGNCKTMAINFKHFIDLCTTYDDTTKPFQEALYNADYLLIDEVSSYLLSNNVSGDIRNLFAVIDDRCAEYKPTIITSNNSPEEFAKAFGQSTYSRLQARTKFINVPQRVDVRSL